LCADAINFDELREFALKGAAALFLLRSTALVRNYEQRIN
jgi:hypothetical protein